uniref:Uncharacterized protein n=1 Tax=Cannabis sativa TaxID=3483 RepID=A0A803PKC8_CANSA
MTDPVVRARDILALQEKFVVEEFMSKVEGTPSYELMPRSAELVWQFITMFSRAFVAGSKEDKELEDLRKSKEQVELEAKLSQTKVEELSRDLKAEKENGKKQYDQAVSDYIYTTLSKVPDFDFLILGAEAAEMAKAFRAMSPTQTQWCGGNLFPKDTEVANTEKVAGC